jgi:hypothetical protein
MISQLKQIEKPAPTPIWTKKDEKTQRLVDFILNSLTLEEMGGERFDKIFVLEKEDKKYEVHAYGLAEDFRITLDGRIVLESVFDDYYEVNPELVDIIVD